MKVVAIIGMSILLSSSVYAQDAQVSIQNIRHEVAELKKQIAEISGQLKNISQSDAMQVDFNGSGFPRCDRGSFIAGLKFGVDDHLNPHGVIECAKVQPAIQ
jgi:hypothetical protein